VTIAIHDSDSGFHLKWISSLVEKNIDYKIVDCHSSDIIRQLANCDALVWHHSHSNPKMILIAKQILFALGHSGFVVFSDFKTNWHFDDKIGQKFLLEAIKSPLVPTYLFVEKETALNWALACCIFQTVRNRST